MSEIVFVLGAGASVHAGVPVMANFLERSREIGRGLTDDPIKADFDRVRRAIHAIQRVHSKANLDVHNLEAVFTILESAWTIDKLPGFNSAEIPSAIHSFKKVITRTLDMTAAFQRSVKPGWVIAPNAITPKDLVVIPSSTYHSFANTIRQILETRPSQKTVSIISFNYDIGLDFALVYNGIVPNYNLPDNDVQDPSVALIKPHGSLNWGRIKTSSRIVALDPKVVIDQEPLQPTQSMPSPFRCLFGSKIVEHMNKHKNVEVEDVPVLVAPGIYKAEQHFALKSVWSAAARELSEAEDIIVIGFSLPTTDFFFNHLYALGTEGESVIRRFWVINPDGTREVERRFSSILGAQAIPKFVYHVSTFENAIRGIRESYGLNP